MSGTITGQPSKKRTFIGKQYKKAMTRIGLLSDTHGFLDPRVVEQFADVDELWHAGDIGSVGVLCSLRSLKPLKAVYGNADGFDVRRELNPGPKVIYSEDSTAEGAGAAEETPEGMLFFKTEGVKVLMTHIGGHPGRYTKNAAAAIKRLRPDIFVAGHSHILRVIYDKAANCLYLNPGACGHYGIHTKRTVLKFVIDGNDIKDMEIVELNPEK